MGNSSYGVKKRAQAEKSASNLIDSDLLAEFVRSFLTRADEFLSLRREHGSPLYVVDNSVLAKRARQFVTAFRRFFPDCKVFYAIKSNNHPQVCKQLVKSGLGLDVSSGLELEAALSYGATEILFSGPGKTDVELSLASKHRERVTVLLDSFGELERLERVASSIGRVVRAGVRLTAAEHGLWRKFGIPLADLARFIAEAATLRHVSLRGLQFHTSWNLDPAAQVDFIARAGVELSRLDPEKRSKLAFLDIGGGFWPTQGEWLHRSDSRLATLADGSTFRQFDPLCHHVKHAAPIEEFASQTGAAMRAHILPHVNCRVYLEPGRWLCHDAMHILLTVIDKKADDLVITDGGTNAVGWERFETDYFPVINLSRPGIGEKPCMVQGSLCTPHDVWGFAYHGESIGPGDALLIPTQGAYTYSLRQQFIKPLPKVVALGAQREIVDWDI